MKNLMIAGVLFCICFVADVRPYSVQRVEAVTVTGTLFQIVAVGGESTGWAIRLDSPIKINGKPTKAIEVAGPVTEFARLKDKHVRATGVIRMRRGIERRDWSFLQVNSIDLTR